MLQRLASIALLVCLSTLPAAAQDRGFVRAIAGATFGTEGSSAVAGGVVIPIAPNVQIVGEIGRLQNIASNDARDEAQRVEREIEESFGPITFDVESRVTTPAFYAMAGGRFLPSRGRVRPFAGASAGFARVSPDYRFSFALDGSDLTEQVIEAGILHVGRTTNFLAAISGGVWIETGAPVAVEAGYTWLRVFTNRATNLNRVYGAIAFRF